MTPLAVRNAALALLLHADETELPAELLAELESLSNRGYTDGFFERHESEFQQYRAWPGTEPKPTEPEKVLEVQ